jgi:hypothetical protein
VKPETAYGILQTHNRMRRGENDEPQPTPEEVGKAIEVACKYLWEFKDAVPCFVDLYGDINSYDDQTLSGELFVIPEK